MSKEGRIRPRFRLPSLISWEDSGNSRYWSLLVAFPALRSYSLLLLSSMLPLSARLEGARLWPSFSVMPVGLVGPGFELAPACQPKMETRSILFLSTTYATEFYRVFGLWKKSYLNIRKYTIILLVLTPPYRRSTCVTITTHAFAVGSHFALFVRLFVSLYNKQNEVWTFGDKKNSSSLVQTRCLNRSLSYLARYRYEPALQEKITSLRDHYFLCNIYILLFLFVLWFKTKREVQKTKGHKDP